MRNRIRDVRARLLRACALLLLATPAAAQLGSDARAPIGDRLERAVEALRTHQDTSGVAGLSAAIAVDGRLVWTGGFGYANLENRHSAIAYDFASVLLGY